MVRQLEFELGEVRHVKLEVRNIRGEQFEISSASFELTGIFQTAPEDSGTAQIIGHTIDVVIAPREKQEYDLKIAYVISDETLIDVIRVRVV